MLYSQTENNKTSPFRHASLFKTNELVKPRREKKKSVKHVSEGGRVGKKKDTDAKAIEAQS